MESNNSNYLKKDSIGQNYELTSSVIKLTIEKLKKELEE